MVLRIAQEALLLVLLISGPAVLLMMLRLGTDVFLDGVPPIVRRLAEMR